MPNFGENYTVIAPDLRGFGYSDRPPDGYDKRTVAEDVHELVQQLGFGLIHLVSHDVGIEHCGHYIAEEQPDRLAQETLKFVAYESSGNSTSHGSSSNGSEETK